VYVNHFYRVTTGVKTYLFLKWPEMFKMVSIPLRHRLIIGFTYMSQTVPMNNFVFVVRKMPSYGELIDLLSDAERELKEHAPELLCDKVRQRYPHVSIGQPARFFDTVTCLAAPTRPSHTGPPKLCGSPLSLYRKRDWIPRARQERERLLSLHLITSSDELFKAVSDIDHMMTSTSKKKHEKLSLLRSQINIWKKVLKRKIIIPFTYSRSQRPVDVIVQELADYIDTSDLPLNVPLQMSLQVLLASAWDTNLSMKTHMRLRGIVVL